MLIVLKTCALFFSILIVMPVVFLLLVSYLGKGFALSVNKNAWIKKTQKNHDMYLPK